MIVKNSLIKVVCYVATSLLVLITVPIIIKSLGIEMFGVVGIVTSFVAYLTVITNSFSSSVSRNMIFLLQNKDINGANKEFNSILFLIVGIGVVFYPILYHLSDEFVANLKISSNNLIYATDLLRVVFLVFFINAIAGVLGSCYVIRERYDLQSYADLAQKLILNIVVIFLLSYWSASLNSYSIGLMLSAIVVLAFNSFNLKKLVSEIEITFSYFSLNTIRNNLSLNWWLMVNQIGALLYHQSALIIAGIFIGTAQAGILAISLTISSQIRVIATLISSVFQTKIMKFIASGEDEQAIKYFMLAIKSLSFITVVISSLYIGGSSWVLKAWLGDVKEETIVLSVLCTSYLPLVLGLIPSWTFLMAKNDISLLGKVTFINGILNVIVSFILIKNYSLGIYATIIPFIVLLIIQNLIIVPVFLKKHNVNIIDVYKIIALSFLFTIFLSLFTYNVFLIINPTTAIGILASYLFVLCFILTVIYFYFVLKYRNTNIKLLLSHLSI